MRNGQRLFASVVTRYPPPMPRPSRHLLDLGGFRAVKIGAPGPFADLYYATMAMGWPAFIALVTASFLVINLGFGLLYAALPGAIGGMAPGSVADGFFFSIETLGTVGYGNMAPATHRGHLIASLEILLGIFFSATVTGLIFARFARPRTSFVFARVAVLTEREGSRVLMLRVASTRLRPIADVTAQLSWLEKVPLADGRSFRRLVDLPLLRARNPQMAFSWTLVHPVADDSPMLAALLGPGEFRLTVSLSGIDTLLASQAMGGQSYAREDILRDHEFADMIDDGGALLQFDLTKLHDAHPRQAA